MNEYEVPLTIEAQSRRLEQALNDRDEAIARVQSLEWADHDYGGEAVCPSCGATQPRRKAKQPHAKDCDLAAFLARWR